MGAVFHNRPLHLNQKVSIPFVYARIAHAVLPGLIPSSMNGCPREVKVVNIIGKVVEEQMTESNWRIYLALLKVTPQPRRNGRAAQTERMETIDNANSRQPAA